MHSSSNPFRSPTDSPVLDPAIPPVPASRNSSSMNHHSNSNVYFPPINFPSSDHNLVSNSQERDLPSFERLLIPPNLNNASRIIESARSTSRLVEPSAMVSVSKNARKDSKKATSAADAAHLLSEEIKSTVREEIEKIADKLIKEEVEKVISEKIGTRKISSSRRARVYKKVTAEVLKLTQEIIDKIVEDQLNTSYTGEADTEERVSDEIETRLLEVIPSIVRRSMEKAIADEIIEQVKIEKLSKTPTIEPELHVQGRLGVRHAQTFMVLLFLAISYIQRVDFNVGVVAMTDSSRANPYFREFDWDEKIKSLLLSSFYWGYFVLQIPGGILAEKYGPKLVMTASMTACSLLALLMPISSLIGSWMGLYVMKLLQGVFQSTFIPAVYVFTSRWIPPKEKSRLFTPACGGMQLGVVVGMPITGILCASFLGWPSAFFFSSCMGFFWVVVWIIVAANSPSVHRSISREEKLYIEGSFGFGEITLKGAEKIIPWKSILKSVPFWALVVCHFGQNWAFLTLITEMPAYISNILELNITDNAFFLAMTYFVGWIFIVVFGFLATAISDKKWVSLSFQRKAWNSVAALGGSICFLILGITQTKSLAMVITLLTITVTTNSAAYNGVFSNHADLSPNYIGILMGLSNMMANSASVMAPIYVGYVVKEEKNVDQWSIVFLTSAFVLFFSNVIFIVFGTSEIQPWNTPSDLHLQLEKADAAALSFRRDRRKGQTYVVASTYLREAIGEENENDSPKLPSITHRNSI